MAKRKVQKTSGADKKSPRVKRRKKTTPRLSLKQGPIRNRSDQHLAKWIDFFKNLSSRIKVIERKDFGPDLADLLAQAEGAFREQKMVERDIYELVDWPPDQKNIAFVVRLNTGPVASEEQFDPTDLYVFGFGDLAYSINHLECDGDEEDHNVNTYSTRNSPRACLKWNHVARCIVQRIQEVESKVPLPTKSLT